MRKFAPKFERPKRPWDKARIEKEKKILQEFGLRRKNEIWRAEQVLRNFRRQARELIASHDTKREQELVGKVNRMGLVEKTAKMEDILALKTEDLLNRRLQTVITNSGMASTAKQARQFIVHGHIAVNGVRTRFPSYIVRREDKITMHEASSIQNKAVSSAKTDAAPVEGATA